MSVERLQRLAATRALRDELRARVGVGYPDTRKDRPRHTEESYAGALESMLWSWRTRELHVAGSADLADEIWNLADLALERGLHSEEERVTLLRLRDRMRMRTLGLRAREQERWTA